MLIFDLGFFNGDDTAYYLHKGYRVVAIEANFKLVEDGRTRFKKEIDEERLVLLHRAFHDVSEETITFYVHSQKPDWSTCDLNKTKYWDCKPEIYSVKTINFFKLAAQFGLPHYIKCDVEGLDYLLARQMITALEKPQYLSFELSRFDYYKTFSYLYVAGYQKFQLINQMSVDDEPDFHFTKFSSGKFAEYLDSNSWLSFDECLTRYMKYKELKSIDNRNLALGWIDIHAKL